LVSHFEGGTQTGGFENKIFRRIFGRKSGEDGSWRKLHNDELHNLCSSLNIVKVIKLRRMRWADVARMGRGEVFMGFRLGDPKVRDQWRWWEDNTKMDLRKIGIGGSNWIRLA
jgi:hypothetical protein